MTQTANKPTIHADVAKGREPQFDDDATAALGAAEAAIDAVRNPKPDKAPPAEDKPAVTPPAETPAPASAGKPAAK